MKDWVRTWTQPIKKLWTINSHYLNKFNNFNNSLLHCTLLNNKKWLEVMMKCSNLITGWEKSNQTLRILPCRLKSSNLRWVTLSLTFKPLMTTQSRSKQWWKRKSSSLSNKSNTKHHKLVTFRIILKKCKNKSLLLPLNYKLKRIISTREISK